MKILLKDCSVITDDEAAAILALTQYGDGEDGAPGFNTRDVITITIDAGVLSAKQGDLGARYEHYEWLTWARCDKCDAEWLSSEHPDDAVCLSCNC